MRRLAHESALRVVVLYALFGFLWILLSDLALERLLPPDRIQEWQTLKGWGFVVVSAWVIYLALRTELKRRLKGEELLSKVIDLVPDPVIIRRIDSGTLLQANESFAHLAGVPRPQIIGKTYADLGLGVDSQERARFERELRETGHVRNFLRSVQLPDGSKRAHLVSSSIVQIGGRAHVVSVTKDITDLQKAHFEVERQLERLESLRAIDLAIADSHDLRVVLSVVLEQVMARLEVDAADILLMNQSTQSLGFAAGRGFRTEALKLTTLSIGEGFAGRAALDRKLIQVDDLRATPGALSHSWYLSEEGFVSYFAVPLIARGKVNGVLEVFTRRSLRPERSWLEYLEALAGQTAIAIDKASLLEGLSRSNIEVLKAYDATIYGWSRALDFRDRNTFGHTERVTSMTLHLARQMGVDDDELVHIRRGALLHDIGKIGVPDGILQKPGPLTEEEWAIMREHPVIAYKLLAPIDFLRPALDIPYSHHEKWDGSGYPRQLRGEEIPLAARLFAVVDVWDALSSVRPYSDAWPPNRVREYLLRQSEKHFDPAVLDAFVGVLDSGEFAQLIKVDGGAFAPPPIPPS